MVYLVRVEAWYRFIPTSLHCPQPETRLTVGKGSVYALLIIHPGCGGHEGCFECACVAGSTNVAEWFTVNIRQGRADILLYATHWLE